MQIFDMPFKYRVHGLRVRCRYEEQVNFFESSPISIAEVDRPECERVVTVGHDKMARTYVGHAGRLWAPVNNRAIGADALTLEEVRTITRHGMLQHLMHSFNPVSAGAIPEDDHQNPRMKHVTASDREQVIAALHESASRLLLIGGKLFHAVHAPAWTIFSLRNNYVQKSIQHDRLVGMQLPFGAYFSLLEEAECEEFLEVACRSVGLDRTQATVHPQPVEIHDADYLAAVPRDHSRLSCRELFNHIYERERYLDLPPQAILAHTRIRMLAQSDPLPVAELTQEIRAFAEILKTITPLSSAHAIADEFRPVTNFFLVGAERHLFDAPLDAADEEAILGAAGPSL